MASPYKQIGQNLLDPEDWAHYGTEPTDVEHYHFHTWALNFSIKTLEYDPNYEIEIWQSYDTEVFGEISCYLNQCSRSHFVLTWFFLIKVPSKTNLKHSQIACS